LQACLELSKVDPSAVIDSIASRQRSFLRVGGTATTPCMIGSKLMHGFHIAQAVYTNVAMIAAE